MMQNKAAANQNTFDEQLVYEALQRHNWTDSTPTQSAQELVYATCDQNEDDSYLSVRPALRRTKMREWPMLSKHWQTLLKRLIGSRRKN